MKTLDKYEVMDDQRQKLADFARDIQDLIEILEPDEKVLLDLYMNHKASVYQISILSGRSQQAVSRSIKHLIKRLAEGHYVYLHRNRYRNGLSEKRMLVAYDRFLLGLGYRVIAGKRKMSVKEVRNHIKSLERWLVLRKRGLRSYAMSESVGNQ